LDNEELRKEYLMNESGKVYVGTHHRPKGRRWIYGQFSDVALPAAQLLLEQSGLNPTERGNPVQVVRAIASIVIYTIFKRFFFIRFEQFLHINVY
jgi:transglutaminase 1